MRIFVLAGILVMYLFTNEIQSYQAIDESIIVLEVKKEERNDPLPSKTNHKVLRKRIMVNLKRSCIMKAVSRQSVMLIWKSVFLFVFMKRMIL